MAVARAALVLALVAGCAHGPTLRLVAEAGPVRTVVGPVDVAEAEFVLAMAALSRDVRAPVSPRLVHARYRWNRPYASAREQVLLTGYSRWCEETRRGEGDCLGVVAGQPLGSEERRALALAVALETGTVWRATRDALEAAADPRTLRTTLTLAMAGYLALLLVPEPITKAVAVSLTVFLVSYLGWDVFWGIVRGWQRLSIEAQEAIGFDELRLAGERFSEVLGVRAARLFVMLLTAALAETVSLTARGPTLPGYAEAALLAEQQGFQLAAVGEISAVTVAVGTGELTLVLSAAAMASSSPSAGGGAKLDNIPEAARRQIQEFANRYDAEVTVVGSRASGTAGPDSDWDYIVTGNRTVREAARRELPRGRSGGERMGNDRESGLDIFRVDKNALRDDAPHITFKPEH